MLKTQFARPELFTQQRAAYLLFDDKKRILGISESVSRHPAFSGLFVKNIISKNNMHNYYITDIFPELENNAGIREKFFDCEPVTR